MGNTATNSTNTVREMLIKVPGVTVLFWVTKVLSTGMGEVSSDFIVKAIPPVSAALLALLALIGSLVLQFRMRRYIAWSYWLAVVMVSIFGTMAADVLHAGLGIPYIASTSFYILALATVFFIWHLVEKTLSIHSVRTRRRELFYWATVLTTFALGTAAGDLTATTFHLGYFASGILFAVLIAIPAIGYTVFHWNEVFCFWFAYIMTRPLGASFADWVSVSHARGGLGIGTGPVSLVLTVIITALVGYLFITRSGIQPESPV